MMDLKYSVPVVLKKVADDAHKFKALPTPTGTFPYRLHISEVVSLDISKQMTFHMVGDTGSVKHSDFQAILAQSIIKQLDPNQPYNENPSFLYHLGDVVYNHGEASEYPSQFLDHYDDYNAPIFAIAGNHDGEINPDNPVPYASLDAFTQVFCHKKQEKIPFGENNKRRSMIQPNVYWTLETPLVRFIGLYGNTTKHGSISQEQYDWFVEELEYAKDKMEEQALIICVHHAPYSVDNNHGSSHIIIDVLNSAFEKTGVKPDAVFSGHVHNYQRFLKTDKDGTTTPYIVAGAGGYADLHCIAKIDDQQVEALPLLDEDIKLVSYCDNRFGFLKVSVHKLENELKLIGEYYTLPQHFSKTIQMDATLYDRFEIPLSRKVSSF